MRAVTAEHLQFLTPVSEQTSYRKIKVTRNSRRSNAVLTERLAGLGTPVVFHLGRFPVKGIFRISTSTTSPKEVTDEKDISRNRVYHNTATQRG